MSILSWDDLEESEKTTPMAKAMANNAALDTKPFEEMVAKEEQVYHEQKSLPTGEMSDVMKRAMASVERMKQEDPTGERILAKDKFLINCTTDLNQLVPFKYNWAWSLYLTSCENHWGPSELEFHKDKEIFERLNDNERAAFFTLNHVYRIANYFHSDAAHLNLYAKVTNPECRQTLLKQVMERAVQHHLWTEIEEAFDIDLLDPGTLSLYKGNGVRDLTDLRYLICGDFLIDGTTTTDTLEGQQLMATAMAHYYFHCNLMLVVPALYQVWLVAKSNCIESFERMVMCLLRDIQSQLSFGCLFLDTVISEGSIFIEQKTLDNVHSFIDQSIQTLKGIYPNKETGLLLDYLTDRSWGQVFEGVGNRSGGHHYSVELGEFIGMFDELSPEVDHSATIGGGGSLNW